MYTCMYVYVYCMCMVLIAFRVAAWLGEGGSEGNMFTAETTASCKFILFVGGRREEGGGRREEGGREEGGVGKGG